MPATALPPKVLRHALPPITTERGIDEEWGALIANHGEYGYSSFQGLLPEQAVHSLRREELDQWLNSPCKNTAELRESGELKGVFVWSHLPWDSRHYGFPAARLDVLAAIGSHREARELEKRLLVTALEQCQRSGVRHITARIGAGRLSVIQTLGEFGFELIDGIQSFQMQLPSPLGTNKAVEGVRLALIEEDQVEKAASLAASVYRFDRFHSDSTLPEGVADRLHADWLRNSCNGTAADAVIAASEGAEVLGFVTVRLDSTALQRCGLRLATIVLVATAESARGRGIGRAMTLHSLGWMMSRQVQAVQVGTQLSNIAAARLYESCGFRVAGASLTFRKLL